MLKLIFVLLGLSLVPARATNAPVSLKKLDQVFKHLRTGDGFHARVIKKVHVESLDKDTESKGEIDFSKGRMRLDLTEPEKLLLVYDGKVAWQEEEYDDGDKKEPLITRMKSQKIKKGSAVLAVLLGNAGILKNFRLAKQDGEHYELRPVSRRSDVKILKVNLDGDELESVAYVDSLDNEVTFTFEHFREEKISADRFVYKPPKGAEVNEL